MTHKIQIDGLVRDATAKEAASIDADLADAAAMQQAEDNAANDAAKARASVIAKLAGLGLTADEIAALVGA